MRLFFSKKNYMMRLKFSITFILLLILFLSSCNEYQGYDSCNNYIYIQNNSGKRVYFAYTFEEDFLNLSIQFNEIQSQKRGFIRNTADFERWEQYIKQTTGYIYIYIYDGEYIESVSWNEAKSNYLKKYKLSVKDLKKSNWIITYS